MNLAERFKTAQELAGRYVATHLRLAAIAQAMANLKEPEPGASPEAVAEFDRQYTILETEQLDLQMWMLEQNAGPDSLYTLLAESEQLQSVCLRVHNHLVYAIPSRLVLLPMVAFREASDIPPQPRDAALIQAVTWGELHALTSELTEEQLAEPLTYWGESSAGKAAVVKLREDQYYDGEFIEPRSVFSEKDLDGCTLYAKAGSLVIDIDQPGTLSGDNNLTQ